MKQGNPLRLNAHKTHERETAKSRHKIERGVGKNKILRNIKRCTDRNKERPETDNAISGLYGFTYSRE